jgi:DNA-directed RNA polymerase specialized sigma24 family protein
MSHRDRNATLQHALALLMQGGPSAEEGARMVFECFDYPLVRFFIRQGRLPSVAEELASETFLNVFRSIHTLRDTAAVDVWIWRIARNTLYTSHRRNADEEDMEIQLDEQAWAALLDTQPCDGVGDWITNLCLQGELERFAVEHPERAACIEHVVLESWDTAQLAAYLDRSQAAAKEYLSQCRKHLAIYLRLCFEEGQL